jgi:hypothetical protein
VNQFTYLGPLTRPELFFDREKEIEDAYTTCEQIMHGGVGGVLVIGGRGSGKTSFLDAMVRMLNQQKIACAKIALDERMVDAKNEVLFIKTILTELIRASKESSLLEESISDKVINLLRGLKLEGELEINLPGINFIAKASPEQQQQAQFSYIILRDGLNDYLKLVKDKGRKDVQQGAMLLFDEGDCLTLNRGLLQIIRNVFQNMPRVGLMVAGSTRLLGEVSDVFSPLPRFFRKIELGPYPSDVIAREAVRKPIELAQDSLAKEGYQLEVVHREFDNIVITTTGRMPLEMNLLCFFAFDLGAQYYRIEGKKITLYFRFNKRLLDEAIKQLVGTKGYNDFVNELDENTIMCLKLLSKSASKATLDELTMLIRLNQSGDSLQEMPISKVCNRIIEYEKDLPNVSSLIDSIIDKGDKYKIYVLNSTIIGKPMYEVEDQWVRSYFKYGWTEADVELELGLRPKFGGIRVFGDPIASTLHSVFFPRISEHIGSYPAQNFKAHTGSDYGKYLRPQEGRQILTASYVRMANSSVGHYALNLEKSFEAELLKREIDEVLYSLKEAHFADETGTTIVKD